MLLVSDYNDITGSDRLFVVISFAIAIVIIFSVAFVMFLLMIRTKLNTTRYYFLGLALLMIFLGISRLVLLYHDYFASDDLNYILWLIGEVFQLLGGCCATFMVEKYIYRKTKKMITIFGLTCAIVMIFVQKSIATILAYGAIVLFVFLLLIFLNMFRKTTGKARKEAAILITSALFLGGFVSLVGVILYNFNIFNRTMSQLVSAWFFTPGVILLAYAFIQQRTGVIVDFYQSKRICVVCRGVIKEKMFVCGKCSIFYCITCKEAIAKLENECWNCGEMLERGKEVGKEELLEMLDKPVVEDLGKKVKDEGK